MTRYFEYDDEAVAYLKAKDAKLGRAIDAVGHVYREMEEGDLFSSVVHHIVGQQISTAAQRTVWARMQERFGVAALETTAREDSKPRASALEDIAPKAGAPGTITAKTIDASAPGTATPGVITPEAINAASVEELQSCGITFKKAEYIKHFAEVVSTGAFDLDAIEHMSDEEAIKALSSLPGIGAWTAEMLLLFCLGRPDVLSFGDLAIHRGMRMVYHHREITRERFERYRRRYSPYGSVASLYLWAISHMDVPGYDRDYAPPPKARKSVRTGKSK